MDELNCNIPHEIKLFFYELSRSEEKIINKIFRAIFKLINMLIYIAFTSLAIVADDITNSISGKIMLITMTLLLMSNGGNWFFCACLFIIIFKWNISYSIAKFFKNIFQSI